MAYFKPKAFVLENVPNLVSMEKGKIKDSIIAEFEELGYTVKYKVLLASNYGVPQNRRRVVFVGLKNKEFIFPEPTAEKCVTSKEALSDLPENTVLDGEPYGDSPKSEYQRLMRSGSKGIFNHEATAHTEQTKRIIALVPDGGNYKDLPEELQNTRKVNIAWTRINSKKPSMTIDTGHNPANAIGKSGSERIYIITPDLTTVPAGNYSGTLVVDRISARNIGVNKTNPYFISVVS